MVTEAYLFKRPNIYFSDKYLQIFLLNFFYCMDLSQKVILLVKGQTFQSLNKRHPPLGKLTGVRPEWENKCVLPVGCLYQCGWPGGGGALPL